MVRLPGGFSPLNAVRQAGAVFSPGVNQTQVRNQNLDIFGDWGKSTTPAPQVKGANGTFEGSMFYDPNKGVQQYSNGQWQGAGGGGGGGGAVYGANTGSGGAFYDPYAERRASFQAGLGDALGNIRGNASDAFGSGGRRLRGSAESLFNTVKQGQTAIDRSRENVELSRLNSVEDILTFVRNGLKSGASRLSNMNALESSAAGEVGKAFNEEGSGRMRKVGNSAFLQNRDIDTEQDKVDLTRSQGMTDFKRERDEIVSTIGQQVRQQLADLDAEAREIGATGPEVEAERQRIIDAGMGQLGAVDKWLTGRIGGVKAQKTEDTRKRAIALRQGGVASSPFEFGEFEGMDFQGGAPGAPIDQLPIFTRPRDREL
jgi:hypothetical protein